MKKLFALSLAVVLLLALCACGTQEEEAAEPLPDPAIGTWTLTGLELEGADVSAYSVQFDIRLEFRPDGTGTVTSGENSFSVTWQNGSFYDGSEAIAYTVEGNTLSFEAEGLTYLFTRS